MASTHHKVIIIGTGPAGYTAGIYTSRAGLEPVIFEGSQPGGQLTITTEVENFPGFPQGIQGPALMEAMRDQAVRFGSLIKGETVTQISLSSRPFQVITNEESYTCDSLIIATGASARWLGLKKDEELSKTGGGVSACATCDGFFYRGKEIAVVGGGDTALEEALFLTRFASLVHLIHRRDQFRASKPMQTRIFENPKIKIHWNKTINAIETHLVETPAGDKFEKIRGLKLQDTSHHAVSELAVEGLFVAIGHQPNTALFREQLRLDENGYVLVEKGSSITNIPGVFACGDVQDHIYRQAISAAGSGCMAGIDAERWLAAQG